MIPDEQAMAARMLLREIEAIGLDLDTLQAVAGGAGAAGAATVAAFAAERLEPALTKGQRTAWAPYLELITNGYPGLCACFCDRCLDAFRGDSKWRPCACVAGGSCDCRSADLAAGEVAASSCLEHCAGVGAVAVGAVRLSDWEVLARWAQLRAQKRVAVRNHRRGEQGRATFAHDGRSAVEHLRNAASALYKLALGDDLPGVRRNLAAELTVKPRVPVEARAYTPEQLEELWQAIFTSGGSDPDLDMLIVWVILETGARRGGPVGLVISDLKFHAGRIRLGEKNGKADDQPASAELLAVLLAHALRRGDIVLSAPPGLDPADVTVADVMDRRVVLRTDAPVLYYRPKLVEANGETRRVPHPLTKKRYETLWGRLKAELPWLEEKHGRPHDLRKTMGTFVERAYGHAIAQAWLRHSVGDTTGIYTAAGPDEVAEAHRWLVGHNG
jgi:integrase/recombinase XerC